MGVMVGAAVCAGAISLLGAFFLVCVMLFSCWLLLRCHPADRAGGIVVKRHQANAGADVRPHTLPQLGIPSLAGHISNLAVLVGLLQAFCDVYYFAHSWNVALMCWLCQVQEFQNIVSH